MSEDQIRHIEEFANDNPVEWRGFGGGRTVREYIAEYSHKTDLYDYLCFDFCLDGIDL